MFGNRRMVLFGERGIGVNRMRVFSLAIKSMLAALLIAQSGQIFGQSATHVLSQPIRLNQIQVVGTHNSYHIKPHPSILQLLSKTTPAQALAIAYTHRRLAEQFSELGIRQIELDIFADPEGGHYARPLGPKLALQAGLPAVPDFDPQGDLNRPGLKVLHVPDFDYATTVKTFQTALQQVKTWSKANPRHVPIMILVELKQDHVSPFFPKPKPFDRQALDLLDQTIFDVFSEDQLVTPDTVRGNFTSLPVAIAKQGWPRLDDCRGKVMFAMDNGGAIRDDYLEGHEALKGRALFVSVDPDHPAAAFMKLNDPVGGFDQIQKFVKQGFLVRTRADWDTEQARQNNTNQRDRAFASGAHFISTDYPEPNLEFSPYCVRLPQKAAVISNPLIGNQSIIEE